MRVVPTVYTSQVRKFPSIQPKLSSPHQGHLERILADVISTQDYISGMKCCRLAKSRLTDELDLVDHLWKASVN